MVSCPVLLCSGRHRPNPCWIDLQLHAYTRTFQFGQRKESGESFNDDKCQWRRIWWRRCVFVCTVSQFIWSDPLPISALWTCAPELGFATRVQWQEEINRVSMSGIAKEKSFWGTGSAPTTRCMLEPPQNEPRSEGGWEVLLGIGVFVMVGQLTMTSS